ncbi:MAG: VIT domain-containing protein [Planctomycetota bacterium]
MRAFALLGFTLLSFCTSAAWGQGVLVNEEVDSRIRLPRPWVRPTPRPTPRPGAYKIESIAINATLKNQVAKVQVEQKFRNTGSRQMEVAFVFPLPADGAIDQLTLLVDGKEFAGKLLPADQARAAYEAIVRKNQDPALLEWVGNGMFRTSVFPVPAGAERTVTLRYTQLCRKKDSLTDFTFPLATAKYTSKPLDRLSVRVAFENTAPIANLYSPTHQVKIERPSPTRAIVTHEAKGIVPAEDFRLFCQSSGGQGVGASLVSYRPSAGEPGYFLLLASPPLEASDDPPPAKTVLMVIDRSGSMSGKKIEQAKGAARTVLNRLREGDTFNIVAYDTEVESFRPELQEFDSASRAAALAFVDGLFAGGSTNIDGALGRALGMLTDSSRPSYVLFLTDGLPTAGETTEAGIVQNAKKVNAVRARLFTFGVGYDVNSRLLEKLRQANFGQSEYVRPDEDIEASVARLYNRIGTPVLTDVRLEIDVEQAAGEGSANGDGVSGVYPGGAFDLFAGDQAVIVGRYARAGAAKVTLTGAVAGKEKTFDFPAELAADSGDDTNAFVGRLWATRRVADIIDQLDLSGDESKPLRDELIDELVSLATRHGIVTQYTSFLADEGADHNALASNREQASRGARALDANADGFGFRQRWANSTRRLGKAAPKTMSSPWNGRGGGGAFAKGATPAPTSGSGRSTSAAEQAAAQGAVAQGATRFYDAQTDRTRIATNIRQIGRKTFFNRAVDGAEVWCDSTVNEEEEKNAKPIERYSREYFDLVAKHGKHVAPYLAIDEPVVVKLGGEVYRW